MDAGSTTPTHGNNGTGSTGNSGSSNSTTGTTRLRRRSFFEASDSDNTSTSSPSPSHLDSISLHTDGTISSASALNAGNASNSAGDNGSGTSTASTASSTSSVPLQDAQALLLEANHGRAAFPGRKRGWKARLWRLPAWFQVQWQALRLRRARAWRRASTTETLVVQHWTYATKWLQLACLSLILLQVVLFWWFQVQPLALHVEECIFQDKMLASRTLSMPMVIPGANGDAEERPGKARGREGHAERRTEGNGESSAAAKRLLERRFEQQFAPTQHDPSATKKNVEVNTRLPWTCIALLPWKTQQPEAAEALRFLLPRSRIVDGTEANGGWSSRLRIVVGDKEGPRDRNDELDARAAKDKSVVGALLPAAALQEHVTAHGLPDIVFVTTEVALEHSLHFREKQQDAMEHRRLAMTPSDNKLNEEDQDDGEDKNDQAVAEADAETAPSQTQFAIFLLKSTVPDRYDRTIRKQWEAFLHVVRFNEGSSGSNAKPNQYTNDLLSLWKQHPEWPMLSIRAPKAPRFCAALEALLDPMNSKNERENVAAKSKFKNIQLSCAAADNTPSAIARLQNQVGIHLFPIPVDFDYEAPTLLETLAVGAMAITHNTPIIRELMPDECGLRIGSCEATPIKSTATGKTMPPMLETYHASVTVREIERAVENVLGLDRIHRVAAGRAARAQYLMLRAHYLTAVAALDAALCELDRDDAFEPLALETGQRKRQRIDIDVLSPFLY